MASGIYAIINKKNGKVYIGSTNDFDRRWREHRNDLCKGNHNNSHLQGSWNKCGETMFKFGILEYVDNLEDLVKAEQFWMDIYREEGKELYNFGLAADNPWRGCKHTKESKQRMSAIAQNCSEETRRRRSEAHKGKKPSKETRQRMSKSHKGQPGAMLGRKCGPLSEEHKHKISNTLMGHPVSDESRRKIAEGHRGEKRTEEQRRRMSDAQKVRRAKERNDDKD